jgi:hypothetical protein
MPRITTTTRVGAHPAVSTYLTENLIAVDVVPVPGVAVPLDRTTSCPLPLQLAATAGDPAASIAAATASMAMVIRLMGTC